VEGALAGVSGVKSAKCDYKNKTALVVLEDDAKVDQETLVAALKSAGFGGSVAN